MKLTHALHNCLTRLKVCFYSKRRILGSKTPQSLRHFLLIAFSFWLNSNLNDGIWKGHRLQYDVIFYITQGITGCCFFKTRQGYNISSKGLTYFFPVVRMHHHHSSNSFALAFGRVLNIVSLVHHARINPCKRQRSNEWIIHYFESQTGKWHIVISASWDVTLFVVITWLKTHVIRDI